MHLFGFFVVKIKCFCSLSVPLCILCSSASALALVVGDAGGWLTERLAYFGGLD